VYLDIPLEMKTKMKIALIVKNIAT